MAKDYSPAIKAAIEDFFAQDDWKYEPMDENGIFRTGLSLKSKIKNIKIFINVKDESFSIVSVLPFGADNDTKAATAEFITRANYGAMHGAFEMDYSDGELRYRTSLFVGKGGVPTFEQVKFMMYVNVVTVEKYGDGLMKVLFNLATPEEAVKEIEG
ncbi:MAG: hypothetical protein E7502_07690 [Ruminococcus sp.]|nr:hypothetical protein [Ruminococcus sp.]